MLRDKSAIPQFSKRLSVRAIVAGILITLVTSGLVTVFQVISSINSNSKLLSSEILARVETYRSDVTYALIEGDAAAGIEVLKNISAPPFVIRAGLYHNDDQTLAETAKPASFRNRNFTGIADLVNNPIRELTLAVTEQDQVLGYLKLELDVRFRLERISSSIVHGMYLLLGQGVLISCVLAYFYLRYLIKPINEVARQIKESPITGNTQTLIGEKHLSRDDEIGILVREANRFIRLINETSSEKESALAAADQSYKSIADLLESLPHFINVKDTSGRLMLANKSFLKALKLNPETYIGADEDDFMTLIPEATRKMVKEADEDALALEIPVVLPEVEWKHADGSYMALEVRKIAISYRGQKAILSVAMDVTERKEHQARVQYLAYHDSLTGLPNRHLFLDRLDQALLRAERSGLYGALIFFDLDNFKNYNDTRGHLFGDEILANIASRLKETVRSQDTVARLGGDEFVVCMTELSEDEQTAKTLGGELAERIVSNLRKPLMIENFEVNISASLGIAYFNSYGLNASELLQHADMAMYKAKDSGRNKVIVFEDKMADAANRLRQLKADCKQALAEEQFFLVFQPQINSETKQIIGAEALIRWRHPERGVISPGEFIPLLEEAGLMTKVGQWVLKKSIETTADWHNQNLVHDGFKISINVSPQQFRQSGFADEVQSIIHDYSLEAQLINLEITESMIIDDIAHTASSMNDLRNIGINFSIDDFGTGYSNLNYLKQLPLDVIKVDQSFIRDLLNDQNSIAIVHTILTMAKQLKLTTIAEGVETNEQLLELKKMGCHVYQGYLYSPPVEAERFQQLLTD
ncbi:putative bifunctional diguanylate cyclase/phosphodiesterase [Reinekea marinisedimentorum]|uniref:cyclic-guanylate-specific phosphodiesterase n=1 Tax=Reinekea marinisedimentorum TaxID=230495 RepID=A0A4R3I8B3_9GAMM|nr:EAL domain-containing protein [Reinekea marinisedimentorum]TCS42061.1 PAS domain S-box-containing protein/diguanylate cyclase (GGDEF)-like protein [Reinekea marinisedimentorum]